MGTSVVPFPQAPVSYTAAQVLPLASGQKWTMRNQYGDSTYFEILARSNFQACQSGTFLDMYITKDHPRAYWGANIPGAWDHFILKQESNSWRAVTNPAGATVQNPWIPALMTEQMDAIKGLPVPYFLLPPNMSIHAGQELDIDTAYKRSDVIGSDKSTCISTSATVSQVEWHTKTFVTTVSTPMYSGPVVATRFCEGNGGCIYPETWFFASGIGLVEIDSEFPSQPTLSTKRIK